MIALGAASKESYERAYPFVTRLHILQEIEDGIQLIDVKGDMAKREQVLDKLRWDARLRLISPAHRHRLLAMAVRRAVLSIADMPDLVALNWMSQSTALRKAGRFEGAKMALRSAEMWGLGPNASHLIRMQEGRILRASGDAAQALKLLEPVEVDAKLMLSHIPTKSNPTPALPPIPGLDTPHQKLQVGEQLFLATQLIVESGQKHGAAVVDRYKLADALVKDYHAERRRHCEDDEITGRDVVQIEYGRYLESMYNKAKDEAGVDINMCTEMALSALFAYYNGVITTTTSGSSSLVMQALPRMISLW